MDIYTTRIDFSRNWEAIFPIRTVVTQLLDVAIFTCAGAAFLTPVVIPHIFACGLTYWAEKISNILGSFFVLAAITTVSFAKFSCDGYPGIEKYVADKIINFENFKTEKFTDWLAANTTKYARSFYFKNSYQVNYLPGISVGEHWKSVFFGGLNKSIHIILMVNLIISICAAFAVSTFAIKQYVALYKLRKFDSFVSKKLEDAYAVILFAFPLFFLFFYDSDRNFYRSFFINLLASIMLTMLLSQINLGRIRSIATTYFMLCGVVVCISLIVNVPLFTDKFRDGFEGPSMSTNKNWDAITHDVLSLAQDCGMDLSKGRIIVDDMTYDSLKRYSHLYPVTYLDLSGSIANLSSVEIISKVHPNFAIVRCEYLRSWGVVPQKTRNQFCGVNFISAK